MTEIERKSSTPRGLTSVGKLMKGKNGMPATVDNAGVTKETLQYDLFSTFYGNDQDTASNSVEFWDAIPKFSVHRNKQIELRNEYGHLNIYKKKFTFRTKTFEKQYEMGIQPALITEGDKDVAYYPSNDEELVWEALVKFFSDQQYGLHDPKEDPPSSFVRFTLRMIQKELAKHNHKRSIPQIRHAVEVLSRSILILTGEGRKKPLYRAPILADVIDVTRDDYLENPDKFWIARLPVLISNALKTLEYRQFNATKSLKFKDPLSRWFHKRLIHRFTHAEFCKNSYHISLSRIEEESGFFNESDTTSRKVARIERCYKELKSAHIIIDVKAEIERAETRGKPITGAVWTLFPHMDFAREEKAANARLKDAKSRLSLVSSRRR